MLHGDTGYQQLLVNAQGRRVDRVGIKAPDLQRREPVAGDDLILTIDHRLQQVAEEALGDAARGRGGDRPAPTATSWHSSARRLSTPTASRAASPCRNTGRWPTDLDKPLIDRALRGVYPPGSTIKPLVALAALEYGVVDARGDALLPRRRGSCPDSSHKYRDWKKGGHGTVDMHKAIAQSCDIYFYGISDRDRHRPDARVPGAASASAQKTGIDLARRAQRPAAVARRGRRRRSRRRELQVWFPGETVIAGIGQGYMLATPLQLAHVDRHGGDARQALPAAAGARRARFVDRAPSRTLPPRPLPDVTVRDPALLGRRHRRHGRRR